MPREKAAVLAVDPHDPDLQAVGRAAQIIREGGLVILPTDTVYGLVCDPRLPSAVNEVYRVKERERELPLALLLHDVGQVGDFVEEMPQAAVSAMQQFWPGPLTVVLRDESEATAAVRAGKDTVGLRLPAHVVPRLVADAVGCAMAGTSANRSGRPAPTSAAQAAEQLGDVVQLVLDAGPAPLGQESTVVSFAEHPPRLLRAGGLSAVRLREVLGELRGN
jgi:L-threonylcarbamoyladenylate synthase